MSRRTWRAHIVRGTVPTASHHALPPPRYRQSLTVDTSTRRVAPAPPARSTRLAVALGAALVAGFYVWAYARANSDFVSDFDQVWAAARGLWNHRDPYKLVGPRG